MDVEEARRESEVYDDSEEYFIWSKERKLLTSKETKVDWLCLFGHSRLSKALNPLISHKHRNKFEVVVSISGIQQYSVEEIDYQIYGGEAFFTFPGEVHKSAFIAENPGEFYWFQIDIVKMDAYLKRCDDFYLKEIYLNLLQVKNRVCTISKEDIVMLKEAFILLSSPDYLENARGFYLLMSFLVTFIQSNLRLDKLETGEKEVSLEIKRSIDLIESKIFEHISLEALADMSSFSLSGFKLRFKQEIGISPRDYINIQKIEKAKEIIAEDALGTVKVTELAHLLGFSSSDYFATVFKRYTGVSPSNYKKMLKTTTDV